MSTTIKGHWEKGERFGFPAITYRANGVMLAHILYFKDSKAPFTVESIDGPWRVVTHYNFETLERAVKHAYLEADEWFNQLDAGLTMTHPDDCGFRVEGDTFKKTGGE